MLISFLSSIVGSWNRCVLVKSWLRKKNRRNFVGDLFGAGACVALGEFLISPPVARAATIDPVIIEGIYSALEIVRLKSIAKQLNSADVMGLRVSSAYFFKAAENALIFFPIQSMIREKQGFGFSTSELRESLFSAEREIQRRGVILAPGQLAELLPKRSIAKAEALTITSRSPIELGTEYDRVLKDLEMMLQGKQNASRRNAQSEHFLIEG